MRHSIVLAFAVAPDKIGGMEAFARELGAQLKPKGWDLVVCFEEAVTPHVREFLVEPGNVTLEVIKDQSAMTLQPNLRMLEILRRYRPSTLVYSIGGAVRWWPLLARLHGARCVYWDQTSRTRAAMNYVAKPHVRAMMSPLDLSLCATRFIKNCSDREQIVPSGKSRVLYSATDTNRKHGDPESFRNRYGIPAQRKIVLQVSWLVAEKGIDVALQAAREVLSVRDDVQFVFCGSGSQQREYEALAQELGISDHVTWTGAVEDLPASGAFSAAEVQIQCSQWQEAFGFVVAEGMSTGLPVIASRIGGLPELIVDGETGFLFEPKSDKELAAAVLRLISDELLRQRMGQASRQRAIEQFDLKHRVSEWVELLTSA